MRVLAVVRPTPEQLSIISKNRPGIEIIRGAAGSGKTTTALLRLRSLIGTFVSRRKRLQNIELVRILVLTYNRTLSGYIEALTKRQISEAAEIDLQISTFSKWSVNSLNNPQIIDNDIRKHKILELAKGINLPSDFILDEIEYVMGRFEKNKLNDYLTARRDGRGTSPRVERPMREIIVSDVIRPYQKWKDTKKLWDWNDLASHLANNKLPHSYDIIIADETQDFSANQIRAMKNQLSDIHSMTLVLDTAQRIYARGFTWQEAGIVVRPENSIRLEKNYRNTIQIAKLASSLIQGLPVDDDATMPDFSACQKNGPLPVVLKGRFSKQIDYVIRYISSGVDLKNESVAFLHPLGGGWFKCIRLKLKAAGLAYTEITRRSEWPAGEENIALSTLHSAKGLEFDHIVIIGLNSRVTRHGKDEDDDQLIKLRRLLAMGIGRARSSVVLGYKQEEISGLIKYLDSAAFQEIQV